jgi:FkbM family methyltransferase
VSERLRAWFGLARSFAIYRRPGRQRALRAFYRQFVKSGDLVFDIGAHLGDRTTAFAALGARVIALEPQADLFAWLKRFFGNDGAVTCLNQAAGRSQGQLEMATSLANPTLASLSDAWRARVVEGQAGFESVRWDKRMTVQVTTLDQLVADHGEPAFCKIDVEGFELEVLEGLSTPLQALSIEFLGGALDQARACVDRLEALGSYRYQAVAGERRSFWLPDWVSADQIRHWIDQGADGLASGDLYARREA